MDLFSYVSAERGRGAKLARDIGAQPELVSQWTRKRTVPLDRCVAIEQATSGAVRRWDLRPHDWHRIWPELIGIEGAPTIPNQQKVA